ncbi:YSIRK-type signal peptide-containing protein [Streptococcus thermophilus]|uniref:YSIRK-type signal peptide-containing protein n=1 Tax=Streptococcus thermophilus TaxID=1308 RepID=UPI003A80C0D3
MGKDLLNNCISRFSIRKLNVAVCSVLLGTLVMLGTDNKVLTDELLQKFKQCRYTTSQDAQL